VDDGSQDGSLALMKKLAGSDPRIHLFHKENGGASTARNLGRPAGIRRTDRLCGCR
jgi:glycosyltransferase involved in cell wall biosynthesis